MFLVSNAVSCIYRYSVAYTVIPRCEAYAARGCIVYATARKLESMDGFATSNIHVLKLDVTEDRDVEDAVKTIIEQEGRIDILVNSAGSAAPGRTFVMLLFFSDREHIVFIGPHSRHDNRSS